MFKVQTFDQLPKFAPAIFLISKLISHHFNEDDLHAFRMSRRIDSRCSSFGRKKRNTKIGNSKMNTRSALFPGLS